ncbi:MAG: single-stranded-DNA-specific exonuclease RecJ [Lachnospiraceae bacterium]|nr:single-stranded-DNA-specific exonuclease RecJ [Lachnospiraceae bacterium]
MEKWVIKEKRADVNAIARQFSIDPVIARLIVNRDILGDEAIEQYLNGTLDQMADPFLMKGMEQAVTILKQKIAVGALIRVVGDYDIDGIMSTFLLTTGLKALGARVDYTVPHRIMDGYGINEAIIRQAKADGIDTIITCDNGISAGTAVKLAKALGMTIIITDHHDVFELPAADAVVDPKQEGCTYPYKYLCGAGVAWRLLTAMDCPAAQDLIGYAAFATIGDIVPLTGENRILVRAGLKQLRETDNIGLQKLMAVNNVNPRELRSMTISFTLGPCLNASGRLGSALEAIHLLECTDGAEAETIALHMKSMNEERKRMTEEGVLMAERIMDEEALRNDPVYVVYLPDCHESVAGIIAGRLKEKYHHPVYVLTRSNDLVKGSGRSTEAYDMVAGLKGCADLLVKFGGHPLAAGISLKEEQIEAFRRRLNDNCGLTPEDMVEKVVVDVELPMSDVTEGLLEQLDLLEPFGQNNKAPVFGLRQVTAVSVRVVGRENNVLKMKLRDLNGFYFDAVSFRNNEGLSDLLAEKRPFTIIYSPQLNEYRGRRSISAVIDRYR